MLAAAMLWLSWRWVRGIWVDLDVYVAGGRAVLDRTPLYDVSVHGLPFTYPPFGAAVFAPLALLPDWAARVAFTVVSLAALGTLLEVVRRRLSLDFVEVLPVVLVVLAVEPLLRTLVLGQVNAVLIAMVVLDCLVVPQRHRGWLIGVAAGVKLTPAVFVVWLLLQRQWGAAMRAAGGGLLTIAVGFLVTPSASTFYWTGGFDDLDRFGVGSVLGTDNQSMASAAARLAAWSSVPSALALTCGVVSVGLGAWVAARCLKRGDQVGALLAVAIGGLLASPVSWSHHWLWLGPVLLWLVAKHRRVWAVVVATTCWFGPFWLAYRLVPTSAPYPVPARLVTTAYVVLGLVTLAVLARGPRLPRGTCGGVAQPVGNRSV